jgi:hypothetical protein
MPAYPAGGVGKTSAKSQSFLRQNPSIMDFDFSRR